MAGARSAAAEATDGQSATAVNKQLTNPVSLTWSLKIENEVLSLQRDDGASNRGRYQLLFQPTLPVLLTPEWKLITRPEFDLVDDKPFTQAGSSRRVTGLGDTIVDVVLSPVRAHWQLGIGPTFIFPTASDDQLGQGNWQVGPAGVAGYLGKRWLAALIAQQWFSYAGSAGRKADSELHLQYLASLFLRHGWSIGTSPIIKFDWRANVGEQVTFPIGLFAAKVVTLGGRHVKLELAGEYAPVSPASYGEEFALKLYVTPVIPALVDGPLF